MSCALWILKIKIANKIGIHLMTSLQINYTFNVSVGHDSIMSKYFVRIYKKHGI